MPESDIFIDDVRLQDLGITVRMSSQEPALPDIRNHSIVVPNRHGAFDLGGWAEPREIVLDCIFNQRKNYAELKQAIQQLNELLIDERGHPQTVKLRFGDAPYMYYNVRLVSGVPIERIGKFGMFSLVFIAHDPYAYAPATYYDPDVVGNYADSIYGFEIVGKHDANNKPIENPTLLGQIGGRNLLTNSDFSKTYKGDPFTVDGKTYDTYPYQWGGYGRTIPNPETNYHAHIDDDTFGFNVVEFNESNGQRNWKGILQGDFEKRLSPTQIGAFTFSVDVYTTGTGTRLFGGFYYYSKIDGRQHFHAGQFNIQPIEVNKWVRMSAQCRLNDDVDFSKSILFYIYGYGFTTNSILYIKNVKLEYGDKATDWTPAPEDEGWPMKLVIEDKFYGDGTKNDRLIFEDGELYKEQWWEIINGVPFLKDKPEKKLVKQKGAIYIAEGINTIHLTDDSGLLNSAIIRYQKGTIPITKGDNIVDIPELDFSTYGVDLEYKNQVYSPFKNRRQYVGIYNYSQYETPFSFVIQGYCRNPKITNQTTGKSLKFNDLTLGADERLYVDSRRMTAWKIKIADDKYEFLTPHKIMSDYDAWDKINAHPNKSGDFLMLTAGSNSILFESDYTPDAEIYLDWEHRFL